MAQPSAPSPPRRGAAGPGRVPVPGSLIYQHLHHFHGAELKVILALCGQQARAGHNQDFRYSIPQINQATGLCERAINIALNLLEKHGLIQRIKQAGPAGNRYRVFQPPPARPKKRRPKPQPTKQKKNKLPRKQLLQVKIPDLLEGIDL